MNSFGNVMLFYAPKANPLTLNVPVPDKVKKLK